MRTDVHSIAAKFAEAPTAETPTGDTETVEAQPVEEVAEVTEEAATETAEETTDTPTGETEVVTYEVPYNGETLKLTIDELIKGNMMERDYQFKRGNQTEKERKAEAKFDELSGVLDQLKTDIVDESAWFKSDAAKELREDDPDAYLNRYEQAQAKAHRYEGAEALRTQQKQDKKLAKQNAELEKLNTAVPDWLDQAVRERDTTAIVTTLGDMGYSQDEMNGLSDHRTFLMAHKLNQMTAKLAKFEQIQNVDTSSNKVTTTTKVLTPGTTQTESRTQSKTRQDGMAKLKQTGRFDDALRLFNS